MKGISEYVSMTGTQKIAISLATFLMAGMAIPALSQDSEKVIRGHKGDRSYMMRLLPPSTFDELPAAIREELENRGCMVPQTYEAKAPENVVHGAFRQKGSSDWAVLCSQNGTSTLLVFWNDSALRPTELAPQPDAEQMAEHDETHILGYARGIDTAHAPKVGRSARNRPYGPFDHAGIEDEFIEKSSVIHYFKDDNWITLQGSN